MEVCDLFGLGSDQPLPLVELSLEFLTTLLVQLRLLLQARKFRAQQLGLPLQLSVFLVQFQQLGIDGLFRVVDLLIDQLGVLGFGVN